jgi:glycosyltransferase involved in cell wall biosynthesis
MTTARRRVVITTETFHPEVGGGETQALTIADALAERGYGVTLVTRRSRPGLAKREWRQQVEIVRVSPAGPGRWKKWALTVTAFPALLAAAREADAVLVSGFRILGAPAVVASRMRRTPCVLKGDSRGELSGEFFRAGLAPLGLTPQSLLARLFVGMRNRIFRRAERFIALSQEMSIEFLNANVPPDHVSVIPNGVNIDRFRPADAAERFALRRRLGLPAGPVAVYTGRLVTYKGLPMLLRVWESLRDETAATLVLVGEGGADVHACEAELRAFTASHRLEPSVRFAGPVAKVEDYLRSADLFVFPTTDEAFGLSLVEAMACGLPVVSTAVGGIRDFLVDGENGIIVPVGDEEALRCALRRAISGGSEVDALGRAARETAVSRFAHHAVADEWVRLFESLSSPRSGLTAS